MRFMIMHKTNARWEAGEIPGPDLIAAVGGMIGGMAQAGVLRAAEGLRASSQGVRLIFAGGRRTVTKGPFTGANELLASFAILKVPAIDDAIDWASRIAGVLGDVEFDIRPVTEPWDIGIGPTPPGLTTRRFMLLRKADGNSEAGVPRTAKQKAEMRNLMDRMTEAGVLLLTDGLEPSSKGVRLRSSGGKHSVTDGPFAESKEMIAGFVILELPSREEALKWAQRYVTVLDDVEADVRLLTETPNPL